MTKPVAVLTVNEPSRLSKREVGQLLTWLMTEMDKLAGKRFRNNVGKQYRVRLTK